MCLLSHLIRRLDEPIIVLYAEEYVPWGGWGGGGLDINLGYFKDTLDFVMGKFEWFCFAALTSQMCKLDKSLTCTEV